jgi:uncharacterized membrane protein YphA (DoxX/SURF4 family)
MDCDTASCSAQAIGNSNIHFILQVLVSFFLAITFLQSGWDKLDNRTDNLNWLKSHFSKSVFKNVVPLLLILITVLEIAAGTLSAAGILVLLFTQCDYWMFWGNLLSAVSLMCLFLGQRIAKDYAGAQSLIAYFLITLFGLWLNG